MSKIVLGSKRDFLEQKTGNTALHLACEGGHVKVVRQLLQAGAKPGDENSVS